MNPSSLYSLIHFLTKDQIELFRSWAKQHSRSLKKNPRYLQLFDRMEKMQSFDSKAIRKPPFDNSSTFYKSREMLVEKLIRCFTIENNPFPNYDALMRTAFDFAAVDLAREYFRKEYEYLKAKGIAIDLFCLMDYKDNQIMDFDIDLAEGIEVPSTLELLEAINAQSSARKMVEQARQTFKESRDVREQFSSEINDFLEGLGNVELDDYHRLKLKVASEILKFDFEKAADYQFELTISLLNKSHRGFAIRMIREISNAITLFLLQGNREKATELTMILSGVEVKNELEERQKEERWIRRSIETAFTFGIPELAEDGIEKMDAWQGLFNSAHIARYHFIASLCFVFAGDFEKGHQVLRRLINSPREVRQHLLWQIDVLDCIFHLEKGNFDYLESTLDSKRKKFRSLPYVSMVLKGIDRLVKEQGRVSVKMVEEIIEIQNEMETIDSQRREIRYFNFAFYLEAKLKSLSLRKIYADALGSEITPIAI